MDSAFVLLPGDTVKVEAATGPSLDDYNKLSKKLALAQGKRDENFRALRQVQADYDSHLKACRDRFDQLDQLTKWEREAQYWKERHDSREETVNTALAEVNLWQQRFDRQVLKREQAEYRVGALEQARAHAVDAKNELSGVIDELRDELSAARNAVDKWRNDWTEQRNVAASAAARVTELSAALEDVIAERDSLRLGLQAADQNHADLQRMVGEALKMHSYFHPSAATEEAPF